MAAGLLHVDPSRVRIVAGQTEGSVDAGPATASRSMYTASNAIAAAFHDLGVKVAGVLDAKYHTGADAVCEAKDGGMTTPVGFRTYEELAQEFSQESPLRGEGYFVWPTADREIPGAAGLPHWIYSFAAQAALVEVNILTGETHLLKVATALDTGHTVNPQQVEGRSTAALRRARGLPCSRTR